MSPRKKIYIHESRITNAFLEYFFKVQISEACNEQAVWLHRTALVIPSKTEVSLYRACHAVHLRTK